MTYTNKSPKWLEEMTRENDRPGYTRKEEYLEQYTKEEIFDALNYLLILCPNRILAESHESTKRWIRDIEFARQESSGPDADEWAEKTVKQYDLLERKIWEHRNARGNCQGTFRKQ